MIRRFLKTCAACVVVALPCLLGCSSDPPPKDDRLPLEGQSVRVLVVDDPAMAAAVRDLGVAWKERSGAELTVEEATAEELTARAKEGGAAGTPAVGRIDNPSYAGSRGADKLPGDVVIYPSPLIGTLARRQWLSPLGEKALAGEDLRWPDVFAALRTREATWDSRTVAVPLGSRVLVCFYRADLLKRSGKEPPQTWSEYQELVQFFGTPAAAQSSHLAPRDGSLSRSETPARWLPTAEPLAEGWAGVTLLARAAAYAKHRDYFTVLFNAKTMEPRIAGPPFVRALEELVAANGKNHELAARLTPVDAVHELLSGHCALALGWLPARADAASVVGTLRVPSAAPAKADGTRSVPATGKPSTSKVSIAPSNVACVPLPGARESFDWDKGAYEQGRLRRVPLLACEGRYASVTTSAEYPAAATQLLLALASGDWAVRVSSASAATGVFRGSQVSEAERWTSAGPSVAAACAAAAAESLDSQEVVYALRIPGREEYLAALDKAVRTAVSGKEKPQEALAAAAAKWRAITEKLGAAGQRTACEQSDVRIEH